MDKQPEDELEETLQEHLIPSPAQSQESESENGGDEGIGQQSSTGTTAGGGGGASLDGAESVAALSRDQIMEYGPGPEYPTDFLVACDICETAGFESVTALETHVVTTHQSGFAGYCAAQSLHSCARCGAALEDLSSAICDSCHGAYEAGETDPIRVPCQWCGESFVTLSDPFCSPACARQRLRYGPPFKPPAAVDDDWRDSPLRAERGIPNAAPRLLNNRYVCRNCYDHGADSLWSVLTHASRTHTGGRAYIQAHSLRNCRTCGTSLRELGTRYCSHDCRTSDSDPVAVCPRCEETPLDIGERICSRDCRSDGSR